VEPVDVGVHLEPVAGRDRGRLDDVLAGRDVADRMVAAGITSILNFAPAVLSVPDGVDVRKVDLSIELQILAYHEQRKAVPAVSEGEPA
jgi:redox-sensing transcriptional repressor